MLNLLSRRFIFVMVTVLALTVGSFGVWGGGPSSSVDSDRVATQTEIDNSDSSGSDTGGGSENDAPTERFFAPASETREAGSVAVASPEQLWESRPADATPLVVYSIDSEGRPVIETVEQVGSLEDVRGASEKGDVAEWEQQASAALQTESVVPAEVVVNDPMRSNQWGLDSIGVPGAWEYASGAGEVIAIVDSGVDPHPDLNGNLVAGYDFVDEDTNTADPHGHGTHVAGTAAAITNNSVGVAGVAPEAKILPVRVLAENGNGTSTNVARGIVWAADNGATIINLSIAGSGTSSVVDAAISYASTKGVVLVAAAGNGGVYGQPVWPASHPLTIAVAATSPNGTVASFSTRAEYVNVAAPGATILSTFRNGGYAYRDGTSMAAPHVAGLVALIREVQPTWQHESIRNVLETTAVDGGEPGFDTSYGWGTVQATQSVTATTDWQAPAPNLQVEVIGESVHASYSPVVAPGVAGYTFEINGTEVPLAPNTTHINDGQSGNSETFIYRVWAYTATGSIGAVAEQSVTVQQTDPATPPQTPVVSVSATGSVVTLTVDAPDTDKWYVYRDATLVKTTEPTDTVVLTGQQVGTYTYTVEAENTTTGLSSVSAPATATVLRTPRAPRPLVRGTDIHVTFWAVADAATYTLERNGTVVAEGTTLSFIDENKGTEDGAWTYTVTAVSATGDRSNPASKTINIITPTVPLVTGSVSSRTATLVIQSPEGGATPTRWQIWRDGTLLTTTRSATESVTLSNQPLGVNTYTVKALSRTGTSAESQPTPLTMTLPAPVSLTATMSKMNVRVSFRPVAGAAQYQISITDPQGQTSALTTTSARSFTDVDRLYFPGTWTYAVTPVDSTGTAGASASTTVEVVAPTTPVVTATVNGQTVTLTITPESVDQGVVRWQIWKDTTLITTTRTADPTITLTGQPLGASTYTVRAVSPTGVSAPSEEIQVTATLSAPTSFTARIRSFDVTLSSGSVRGAALFRIEVSGENGETVILSNTPSRSATDRGRLSTPGEWTYKVTPVDSNGNDGQSRTITVTVNENRTATIDPQ